MSMKIQFDANLDYQRQAIESVTGVFAGQEICQTNFTVAPLQSWEEGTLFYGTQEDSLGIGNRLRLLDEDIHANIRKIQLKNGLAPSEDFDSKGGINLTVEMETGTGKTYVYLRTVFEMNRLYGFTKFIIVVPSIAIKEGVQKSLEITANHFKELYENVSFDYFTYDSSKLADVRNFATSPDIQIMVINIDAFRKSFTDPEQENKANIIHRAHDRMTGAKPIEFIQQTNPIVIVDEPQSVDTTDKSKEAIGSLNPMCTLRYSATHVEKHHMLYKLDSVDAYEQKLVKQIEVAGIDVKDGHNKAYIKLISVNNKKSPISAKIEIDARLKNGSIKRKEVTVTSGADLLDAKYSGGRDVYDGYIIEDIYCEQGNEYISFTSKPDILKLGQALGEVDPDEFKRLQIRKTIEEHLDKEMRLRPQGIKVLSLFFIDKVANYRWYDEDGNPQKGKFALMFEEEYERAIRKPKYSQLFEGADLDTAAQGVHNGYFSVDKKKDSSGNEMVKDSSGKTAADESAYNLIMKDKEKLLSFDSKLKFIFSHSALKEGWDNPNVFQICTLNETTSVIKKRQEIGRGLRICVNQNGERVHGFAVNTLTVMANESYEQFAEQLQKEIENEEGIKFGVVEKHLFANIVVPVDDHNHEYLGTEASKQLWEHLQSEGHIDSKGKVQDSLKVSLKNGTLVLPEAFQPHAAQIVSVLKKVSGNLNIKNRDDKAKVSLNKAVYLSPEFQALWDRIKYKTTFRVDFHTNALIEKCAEEIKINLQVGKARFTYRKAKTEIDRGGVHTQQVQETTSVYESRAFDLPDLITYLQNETNLTRRTIVAIINKSGRLESFKNNPQKFIEQAANIIKSQMRLFIVDGIKYQKIGDDQFYGQELFETNELFGYLKDNMVKAEKSVFDHVVYDSDIELEFASAFERNEDIKLYAKLPGWFKIDTPLGGYNPDWAVLIEQDGKDKLYFVVETKSTLFSVERRPEENAKIKCGYAHFEALGDDVKFTVSNSMDEFSSRYA
ncbi:TPA: DEAD/DEAH box helicase family protein [Salmonella enterica subsp. enterica serovar Typhimurium]|uniref:type III restriction-modification system endonuclease n=1 Tax=Enterobacteriaceae TaxID=543 RepID=UPI002117C2D5|nr:MULTISPECIES: DEAD/DEAH box helicase family protein [Enterobacteriaceae]EKO7326478.1 DEAD/DEAH box helicase family protein [Salmonella enterica]EMA3679267.1 DEAD/DEAH box helicase family protein [Citrobacter freundii]MCQ8560109.1 DEAD/DEAH box helicase family protein [Klebsiella pneumoniae]MDJ2473870.1 DEAD/DEAH box helicase family protein [Salmonella enterica]MED5729084.1 DEAD/DEAH box helicase family protein [Enterobacter hormaechei]